MSNYHVRWMVRRDVPEVLAIEPTLPEEELLRILRERNVIGMVVERDENVVGFMVYELHKTKCEVLHLAVHPERRRQGVGRTMFGKLKNKLCAHRRNRFGVNVDERNLSAQLWLKACGAECVGVKRGQQEEDSTFRFVARADASIPSDAECCMTAV